MPKKNLNFLEMLICLLLKKRDTQRFKKQKIPRESRNIQYYLLKKNFLLVPFLLNFFASVYRYVSDENHGSFSPKKILKERIQVLSPTKGPPAL